MNNFSIKDLFLLTIISIVGINNLYADDKPYDALIRELISKMTIEEKINQLSSEDTKPIERLGLVRYNWHNEAMHGIVYSPATIFPHCITQAASWDRNYIVEMAEAISDEAQVTFRRTKGEFGLNFWSPNVNMTRDPRWGRNQETYGEDPYFISEFAYLFITSMQGHDPKYMKTICSPKHFFAHSGPEKKQHSFNAIISKKDLYETYLPPFKTAIDDAKAGSFMTAFIAINGVPMHANSYFIDTVVRKQWGFDGYVTSDCWGVPMTAWEFGYTHSNQEATAKCLKAGVDLECGITYHDHMKLTLENGLIEEKDIDTAVYRILRAKYRLGIIGNSSDNPYNNIPDSVLRCQKHLDLALRGSQESIVLLENKNNILPIKKNQSRVFITGPYSNQPWQLFGSYHGYFEGWEDKVIRILKAFQDKNEDKSKINYLYTCDDIGSITLVLDSTKVKTADGKPGFMGEYFSNPELKGEPTHVRIDNKINFDWKYDAPFEDMPIDTFSVRWTGYITPDTTDYYTFRFTSDDGSDLFINDSLINNSWTFNKRDYRRAVIKLDSGKTYKITMAYHDLYWDAMVQLGMGNTTTWDTELEKRIDSVAKISDVIVFAGGISAELESEHTDLIIDGFDHGDRTHLELPLVQRKFIKALHKTGKPVILTLLNGSCIGLNWEKENLAAIVEAFYPGEYGGAALADVIYGDVNPSGKLPITFYKDTSDLSNIKDYSMKERTYRYFTKPVLYPFGYGLSYTKYSYLGLEIEKNNFYEKDNDTLKAKVIVKNDGHIDGKEIVQLYVSKPNSTNYDAIKQLVEFEKKFIKAGEKVIYEFNVPINRLCYYDTTNNKYKVENGQYKLMVGASSQDIKFTVDFEINDISSINEQVNDYRIIYNYPQNQILIEYTNLIDCANTPILYDLLSREIPITHSCNGNTIYINYPKINNGVYLLNINNNYEKVIIN